MQVTSYTFFMLLSFGVFLTAYRGMPKPSGLSALPPWLFGLTYYQWVALVLVGGLTLQWQFDRRLALVTPDLSEKDRSRGPSPNRVFRR